MKGHRRRYWANRLLKWIKSVALLATAVWVIGPGTVQNTIEGILIYILQSANSIYNAVVSALLSNPRVAQALFVGIQAFTSVAIVALTVSSVRTSRKMMEANEDMVESNQNVVEETRKDRKRETVKKLLTNIEPLKEELNNHSRRINKLHEDNFGNVSISGTVYPEIDDWDLDLSFFPKHDLGRIERQIDKTNAISTLSKYEDKYSLYIRKRDEAEREIESNLLLSNKVKNKIEETDWEDTSPRTSTLKTDHIPRENSQRESLTEKEVWSYINENNEEIANVLVSGGRIEDRFEPVYRKVLKNYKEDSEQIADVLNNLDQAAEDLKTAYNHLNSELDEFKKKTLDEYDILNAELDEINTGEGEEEDETVKLGTVRVSDVEFEIGKGTVYRRSDDRTKTVSDLNEEDYETDEEYYQAMETETSGDEYDSIYILKDGWVQCIKELRYSEQNSSREAYTYPPEEIEKIRYTVSNHTWNSDTYRFDGRFTDGNTEG